MPTSTQKSSQFIPINQIDNTIFKPEELKPEAPTKLHDALHHEHPSSTQIDVPLNEETPSTPHDADQIIYDDRPTPTPHHANIPSQLTEGTSKVQPPNTRLQARLNPDLTRANTPIHSNTTEKDDSLRAITPSQKLNRNIKHSRDKMLFISHKVPQTLRRQWFLVQVDYDISHASDRPSDTHFICEFYRMHPSDQTKPLSDRRYWLEWHRMKNNILQKDTYLYPPNRSNTARKRGYVPYSDWLNLADPQTYIHGPFDFQSTRSHKPNYTIKTEDWTQLQNKTDSYDCDPPAQPPISTHLTLSYENYSLVAKNDSNIITTTDQRPNRAITFSMMTNWNN